MPRSGQAGPRAEGSPLADDLPLRLARFGQRMARLRPGKYVLTLTVKEDAAYWTIQEMGRVEA